MKNKHYLVIAGIIVVLVCSLVGFHAFSMQNSMDSLIRTIPADNISMNFKSEIGNIIINAPLPESQSTFSIYIGKYGADGWIEFESPKLHETKSSIPNESEAHEMAKNASIPYGGIPNDAVISFVEQRIGHGVNLTTGKYVTNYPKSTVISYFRELNGMPIEGAGEGIRVELGENGEMLLFSKRWRTWEKVGDVPIINATRAVEKLQKGETIGQSKKTVDLNIHTIQLGYYTGYPDREEDTLEPIWIFKGTTTEGSNLKLFVDARETGSVLNFANFTANPVSGKVPLTVFFNDTSRGTIQLWFWDFGDGGRSEERDPVHTYQNPGTYTVSLRAFDESRLADCIKTDYITVRPPAPPVANSTASPTTGNAPDICKKRRALKLVELKSA
jgi:regulatory protein YycI of two-component signal transduction system YycFG